VSTIPVKIEVLDPEKKRRAGWVGRSFDCPNPLCSCYFVLHESEREQPGEEDELIILSQSSVRDCYAVACPCCHRVISFEVKF